MKNRYFLLLLTTAVLVAGCKKGEEASTETPTAPADAAGATKGGAAPQGMKESDLSIPSGGATKQFGSKTGG